MTTARPDRTRFRVLAPGHQLAYVATTVVTFALLIWDIAAGGRPGRATCCSP